MSAIELLISIFVLITVLTVASSAYVSGHKAWQTGNEINEITQNSRIAIDRLARELRQTDEIVTNLPDSEIEFQDGHDESLQYLRYYLENSLLRRQIIIYYLGDIPDIPVRYDTPGALPSIQKDEVIAEYISILELSRENKLIQININDFSTKVIGRNIK